MDSSLNINTCLQYSSSQVPIFDGEFYNYWSDQTMTFFISQVLCNVVEEEYQEQSQQVALQGNQLKKYKETLKRDAGARTSKCIHPINLALLRRQKKVGKLGKISILYAKTLKRTLSSCP